MISLDEAIQIVRSDKTKPVIGAFETKKCFYFEYGIGNSRGFYNVDKNTGELDIFLPQDDFDEFRSMKLVKKF